MPRKTNPKRGKKEFREEALFRLKERFENDNEGEVFDASREPIITPMLKSADGGIERVMEALRAYDDDDARDFIDIYDDLTNKDRQYLTLEEVAVASGIGSLRLAEIAQSAMIMHGQLTTKLLLASNMSKIVSTSIKQALTPKGLADREMMLKAGGIMPVPKGAQIAIQNNLADGRSETKTIETPTPSYLSASERLKAIHDAVEVRRLPVPPSPAIEKGSIIDVMHQNVAEVIRDTGGD
jgi:hypothetical protein